MKLWIWLAAWAIAAAAPALAQPLPAGVPAPAAQSSAMPAPPANLAQMGAAKAGEGYILGANDEVDITLYGQQDLNVKTRIKEDGTVTFPFVGSIQAVGQTPKALGATIREKLIAGGYFTNPIVNVDVTGFVSNSVTVFGNVGSPGVYPLDRDLTVAMMIARAGGPRADGADYGILRRQGDTTERRISFADLGGSGGSSTKLMPGDTLFVPPIEQYFVYGQVGGPGAFPLRPNLSLRQALARAGGPTLAGSEKNVTIFREGKKIKKAPLDTIVKADDVIYCNERLF